MVEALEYGRSPSFTSVSSFLPASNFEELFHGEFSEFKEAQPIIDTIAPACPTILRIFPNTNDKRMTLVWYFPINSGVASIQNDTKEFEIYLVDLSKTVESEKFLLITKTTIPIFVYNVPDEKFVESLTNGLNFCLKAVDFHGLKSDYSSIVNAKLNKDLSCKFKEKNSIVIKRNCGEETAKLIELRKKMTISSDSLEIFPGSFVGILDAFKNKNVTLNLKLKDLNTGYEFIKTISLQHNTIVIGATAPGVVGSLGVTHDVREEITRETRRTGDFRPRI